MNLGSPVDLNVLTTAFWLCPPPSLFFKLSIDLLLEVVLWEIWQQLACALSGSELLISSPKLWTL